ncbi:MAG: zinc-dependent metalloprotease [Verrucomicrobiae bacterium]|nr:zinc-dependent metalloprotease [Verrucomicrobiae bacterium]
MKAASLPDPIAAAGVRFILLILCLVAPVAAQPEGAAKLEISVGTDFTLVIPRSALGRDHLMSASRIPQALAATSTGLSGKIVRFEAFHDGVDLYESTDGLLVTRDLPARRLLTTFPIVAQDDTKVVIDFNRGMRRLYTDIWYAGSRRFAMASRDESLEIPQSRVFAAEKRDDLLVIRQSVQVRDREQDPNLEQRFEVRYFFTPYTPGTNPGREAPATDLRYARFFETQAQLEDTTGRASPKMARFNLSRPLAFHLSANTPPEYVQAVKDGILYWNRAFGTNLLTAGVAPEGVTAPDPRYNIVQWVPWDNAGFAYADLLLDPRNGESQHGQAYMTSVFALSSKARVRALLRALRGIAADARDGRTPGAPDAPGGFPWMSSDGVCQVHAIEFAMQYAHGLQELLADEALTDEAVLQASQDYVREVVAHEVGHVLGLRHNFAGSLGATLNHRELDEWFNAYVAGESLDAYTNRYASTSTMEYIAFKAALQVGWWIRTQSSPLPHDRAAIRWGYFESEEPREGRMLFGTDDQVPVYGDLRRFDFGTEPVVGAYVELAETLRLLPNRTIEEFIAARAPRDPRDRVPLAEVTLRPRSEAQAVATRFADMLAWFRAGTRSLRVENDFDFIGDLNQQDRARAHWKSLNGQLERLGGVDRALFGFLPLDLKLELKDVPKDAPVVEQIAATNLLARLQRLLDAPAYTNFVGLDEKRYTFTPEEKALITDRARLHFEEFEREVLKQVGLRLEDAPRDLGMAANEAIGEDDITAVLEKRIMDFARWILTAKDDARRLKGKVDKSIVEVVDYRFDHETRLAAAKALNDKTGSFRGWALDAKAELNKHLKEDVEGALNIGNFKEFKDSMLSRTLRDWYLKQQDILALLPAPKPEPPK